MRTPLLIKPTIDEVLLAGAKTGLPEFESRKFFHYYSSKGWKVGKQPMSSWTHALAGWKLRWQQDNGESNSHLSQAQIVLFHGEYNRIIARMERIKGKYSGGGSWHPDDKVEFKRLKSRRDELRLKLNITL